MCLDVAVSVAMLALTSKLLKVVAVSSTDNGNDSGVSLLLDVVSGFTNNPFKLRSTVEDGVNLLSVVLFSDYGVDGSFVGTTDYDAFVLHC